MLKRIRVTYTLRPDAGADRDKIQRAFDSHMRYCPVYRSISAAIEVTTRLDLVDA